MADREAEKGRWEEWGTHLTIDVRIANTPKTENAHIRIQCIVGMVNYGHRIGTRI